MLFEVPRPIVRDPGDWGPLVSAASIHVLSRASDALARSLKDQRDVASTHLLPRSGPCPGPLTSRRGACLRAQSPQRSARVGPADLRRRGWGQWRRGPWRSLTPPGELCRGDVPGDQRRDDVAGFRLHGRCAQRGACATPPASDPTPTRRHEEDHRQQRDPRRHERRRTCVFADRRRCVDGCLASRGAAARSLGQPLKARSCVRLRWSRTIPTIWWRR